MSDFNVYEFLPQRQQLIGSQLRSKGCNLPSDGILRSCVRIQPDGITLSLDADGPGLPPVEIDEGKMTATFCITTPRKDRYGDIVIPRGCEPYLENYRRNPRVFFGHKSTEIPIGSARTPEGNLAVEIHDEWIKSTCFFHGETAESDLIFRLICRKELQAASIGFLPVKAVILNVKPEKGREDENEHGEELIYFKDGGFFPQLRFHEWDMTEWSVVSVPANADAISMHLHRGHVDGQPVTDSFKKAFGYLQAPLKVWSPGATFEAVKPVEKNEQVGVVETDPMQGWPLGARFIKHCLETLYSWDKTIKDQDPLIEHTRVKKYAAKKTKRIANEILKVQKFGHDCYPDRFEKPKSVECSTEPVIEKVLEEPEQVTVVQPVVEELVLPIEVKESEVDHTPELLEFLNSINQSLEKLDTKFFELTGKK